MTESAQAMRQLPLYQCHKKVWALKIAAIELANKPTIEELEAILNRNENVRVDIKPDGSISTLPPEQNSAREEVVGAIITPADEAYSAFPVSRDFVLKHNPQVGGYYVVYADGYKSFSPAQAFEEGYTLIR